VTNDPLRLRCLQTWIMLATQGDVSYRDTRIKSFTTLMGMTMKTRKNKLKIAPNPL
jgi:hypothetical protein